MAGALVLVGHLKLVGDLAWDLDRPHWLTRPLAHAGNGQAASRDIGLASDHRDRVSNGFWSDFCYVECDLELIFEVQGTVEIERRRDTWKPDRCSAWGDAESGVTPQRMFGLLHVSIEPAEVNDPGGVGLVEQHPTFEAVPARHGLLSHGPDARALFMTVWRLSTRSAENSCGIRQS